MRTRLLIITFASSFIITIPLLACASDELTSSSASTSTSACDAWQERLQHAAYTMTPRDYHDALQAFIDLDTNQKTIYKDTYAHLMDWHLAHAQSAPERLLELAQDCLHLGHTEGLARASFAYATHPKKSSTYKTMPLQSAFAMQAAMHNQEASALYSLALTLSPQDFTLQDYRYATQIFGQLRQKELGLKTYKEMIARIPHQALAAEDFISAAGCFIAAGNTDVAKTYLTYYFDKEKNTPAPIAYRLCATIATHEGDTERACEYWQMAMGKHSPMHFADYASAASCFVKAGNPSKAALLWKKALSAPDFIPDYTSYFYACDVYAQVRDYESALACVEAFMKLRPETDPKRHMQDDLKFAALIYSKNGLLEKSTTLWLQVFTQNPKSISTAERLCAGLEFFELGDYARASDLFLSIPSAEMDQYLTQPEIMQRIRLSYLYTGRSLQQTATPPASAPLAHKHKRGTKRPKPAAGQSTAPSSAVLGALKLSLARDIMARMNLTVAKMKAIPHGPLEDLRAKALAHVQDATTHLARLEGTDGPSTPSAPISSSSSQASSSSSSSEPANSLFEIQRLGGEMERITRIYTKEKVTFERQAAKDHAKTMLATAVQETPLDFLWTPSESAPTARLLKAKPRGKPQSAARALPGKVRTETSTRASSSSASHAGAAAVPVLWSITPTAQKQLDDLRLVPGFYKKLCAFRRELEQEPWGRRGHTANHASGRAKRLKGDANLFSRRLAKGERFYYRVEKNAHGNVSITILGLKGHDL